MKIYCFNRLHKHEVSTLIKGVNAILRKYDSVALFIKTWCELLLAQESELGEVTEVNRTHPAMKELNAQRNALIMLLSVIRTYFSALKRAQVGSLTPQQLVVIPFFERYLPSSTSANTKKLDELVLQMLGTIDGDVSLQAALQVVGMKVYFDEMKVIQDSITLNKSIMVKFKSEIPKMRTVAIKKSAVKALNNLIQSIELDTINYPEVDYKPLTNELEAFLSEYQVLDKSRRTISRNAAENKKTVASSTTTDATAS